MAARGAEALEVRLPGGVAGEGGGGAAAGEEEVFEVGALFDEGADFVLEGEWLVEFEEEGSFEEGSGGRLGVKCAALCAAAGVRTLVKIFFSSNSRSCGTACSM